jgi:hypothetical protein
LRPTEEHIRFEGMTMVKIANKSRDEGAGRPAKGAVSGISSKVKRKTVAKDATGVSPAGKATGRSSAVGKLSASRILGPSPGRRTVSDETILEAVRAAIRKRSARIDA